MKNNKSNEKPKETIEKPIKTIEKTIKTIEKPMISLTNLTKTIEKPIKTNKKPKSVIHYQKNQKKQCFCNLVLGGPGTSVLKHWFFWLFW